MQMALVRRCCFEEKDFRYPGRLVRLLNMPPEVLHVCEKARPAGRFLWDDTSWTIAAPK